MELQKALPIVGQGTMGLPHGITRAFSDAGVLNLGRDIPVKHRLILASLGLALLLKMIDIRQNCAGVASAARLGAQHSAIAKMGTR